MIVFAWHCDCGVSGRSIQLICWNCGETPTMDAQPEVEMTDGTTEITLPEGGLS